MRILVSILLFFFSGANAQAADWLVSTDVSACAIRLHIPPQSPQQPYLVVAFSVASGKADEPELLPGAKRGELLFHVLHFAPKQGPVAEQIDFASSHFANVTIDQDGAGFAIGEPTSQSILRQVEAGTSPRLRYVLSNSVRGSVAIGAEKFAPALEALQSCKHTT